MISVQVSAERTETLQQNNPRYAENYIAHSRIFDWLHVQI